jgi:hypothetical protein
VVLSGNTGNALGLNADRVPKAIATCPISPTIANFVVWDGVIVGENEGKESSLWQMQIGNRKNRLPDS